MDIRTRSHLYTPQKIIARRVQRASAFYEGAVYAVRKFVSISCPSGKLVQSLDGDFADYSDDADCREFARELRILRMAP